MARRVASTKRGDARNGILDAVNRVIMRHGMGGATIDAIAAEAGMTKGGILYYFTNKEDVITAAIVHQGESLVARRDAIAASLPNPRLGLLRATVQAVLESLNDPAMNGHSAIGLLGEPLFRKAIAAIKKRLYIDLTKTDLDLLRVANILYVLDGIWISKIFASQVVSPALYQQAQRELWIMVEECESCPKAEGKAS